MGGEANVILPFTERINYVSGLVVAVLTYILGKHWFLFASFFVLNCIDFLTGVMKARMNGKENSAKGAIGVWKKFGYWIMILVSFGMSAIFIEMGETIGIDLDITMLLGWFTLATLIVNELRSIFENFVEAGFNVPSFLVKGLEIVNKKIEGKTDIDH